MESDPQYVIRRFESGRYAVDPAVRNVYQRALELIEVRYMCSSLHAIDESELSID